MAKPRVFVSSTYYDLRHIRDRLKHFIDTLGYEAVLFESGDIAFDPEKPLDTSCYDEITGCQILVLIIGGRYGSPASGETRPTGTALEKQYAEYNSITKKEYEKARRLGIPIYIFVEAGVLSEYDTYKANRNKEDTTYVHVDSVNVFRLLDDILAQSRNNFVRPFTRFDDIGKWLRDQWAGLFANFLSRRSDEKTLADLSSQLSELRHVTGALKEYSEIIMEKVTPEKAATVIAQQHKKIDQMRRREFLTDPLIEMLLEQSGKSAEELFKAAESSRSGGGFAEAIGFSKIGEHYYLDAVAWTKESGEELYVKIRRLLDVEPRD